MTGILKKLWEKDISCDLSLRNFEILNFYGNETIFLWNENNLAAFRYSSLSSDDETQITEGNNEKLTLISSPRSIKSLCSYSGRVFIICKPTGIYKLTDKYKFSLLSNSGIGLATEFHHVLTPKNDYLYLGDKLSKKNTPLLPLYANDNEKNENSLINYDVSKILIHHYDIDDKKNCLIINDKKLYKLSGEFVKIIHYFNNSIIKIQSINNNNKIIGHGVLTDANYVVILLIDNFDKFIELRKIHFDGIIENLTFYWNNDKLMSFHSNGDNMHCKLIDINNEIINNSREVIINDIHFFNVNSVKNYNNNIHVLSWGNKLTLFDVIDDKMIDNNDSDEFYKLTKDMIKGTHIIVDRICERAKKLEIINKNIELLKNRIQRINVFMHKKFTEYSPIIEIIQIFHCNYLRMKFLSLPINAKIFVSVKIDGQRVFSSKNVNSNITILELPISNDINKCNNLDLKINLITDYCEQQIWCILNNCLDNSRNLKENEQNINRINFLNAKLLTLRNLMQEDNIDAIKLFNIKKSVRKGTC